MNNNLMGWGFSKKGRQGCSPLIEKWSLFGPSSEKGVEAQNAFYINLAKKSGPGPYVPITILIVSFRNTAKQSLSSSKHIDFIFSCIHLVKPEPEEKQLIKIESADKLKVCEIQTESVEQVKKPEIKSESTDEIKESEIKPESTDEIKKPEIKPESTDEIKKPEIKTESAAEQFEKSDIKPQCAVEHPDQEIQTIQPQPSSSGKNILNQKHVDTIYLILRHQSDTFCILMENGVADFKVCRCFTT